MSDFTARQIIELLRLKYKDTHQWACFTELNVGTGVHGGRWIDFFAFNMYPSKRYWRVAYEVKVSRADFYKELEDPSKRLKAEEYSNECYFVAPAGIINPDETPDVWGLMEVTSTGKLRTKRKAQQRRGQELPVQFIASICRRVSDEKPTLPGAVWSWQGQELDEAQLRQFASEHVQSTVDYEVRKRVAEAKREIREQCAEHEKMMGVIRRVLGWDCSSAETLENLLTQQVPTKLPAAAARELNALDGRIKQLLMKYT